MPKIALSALLLGAIFAPDLFAYVDMSRTAQRANDLGLSTKDYVFAMSIAGTLTGFLFGLFLWKVR
jgi:hypothetical protein